MSEILNRRSILKTSATAMVWLGAKVLAGDPCELTPKRGAGPFYPVDPIPEIVDLTAKDDGKARGRRLAIQGRVFDTQCQPIPNVKVEIWQADPDGHYDHPGQRQEQPLDPHFAYFGYAKTNAQGIYQFQTLIPGPYRIGNLTRAPHIHFALKRDDLPTHVTELYFSEDRAFQAEDPIFQGIEPEKRPAVVKQLKAPKTAAKLFEVVFDIHLAEA